MSTEPAPLPCGYDDPAELEADLVAAEARWAAAAPWRASRPADLPIGATYDVGINCPQDELRARLDAARRRCTR